MMLNEQSLLVNEWFIQRSTKERAIILGLSLILAHLILKFLFISPVIEKQEQLRFATDNLTQQSLLIQKKIDAINRIVTSPSFGKIIAIENRLLNKEGILKGKLSDLSIFLTAPNKIPQLVKAIIAAQDKGINMTSLTTSPGVALVPEQTKNLLFLKQNLYQYAITVEFRSHYFDAIAYIARLEQLPWHLFWDSLDYKVLHYPEAEVTLKMHVLSDQKNG